VLGLAAYAHGMFKLSGCVYDKMVLEPVCVDSPSLNWTEARIVGLWLQLICCTRSVIQPWDFGNRYWPKAEITQYNEENMGLFKLISELTNIHVLVGFLYKEDVRAKGLISDR
jgi:hypothetical protein